MNTPRLTSTFIVCLLLCAAFVGLTSAQDIEVVVTPEEVDIEVGGSIKFEAYAFRLDGNRRPVVINEIVWSVPSDSMGTITDDGFFIAGKHIGVFEIKVVIVAGSRTFHKVLIVRIGKLPKPFFDIKVVPGLAVVPSGTEQQFEAVILGPGNRRIKPRHVRWDVRPGNLGKINEKGLFVAGEETGKGRVIAIIEVDNLKLRAAAKVIVSPPANSAIAGQVTNDNGGAAIEGAVIKAIRLGRIHWVQKARTDADGNYLVEKLIPGYYVLVAHARGFIGEFYDDTRNYLEATPLNIAEDDTVEAINFGLSEGGTITGTVVTEGDSLPLARAHVVAALAVNPRFARHGLTDENGDYALEALPTGSYLVRANAPGYRGEYYDDAKERNAATLVRVEEPETVSNIDYALDQASAISGVVTNAVDGTPIAKARIRVFKGPVFALRHRHFRETRTDENGEYIIQVRPGDYYVSATARGFNGEFYDDVREFSQATLVPVLADSHSTDIDFDLVPRGTISGLVTDQITNEPIAGAVVEAFKERSALDAASSVAGFRAKTDDAGKYLIENVPVGKYLVVAAAETYLPEFWQESPTKEGATLVEVPDNTDIDNIDFTLDKGGSISGLVATESDSTPIAGALIKVFGEDSHRFKRGHSLEDGTYKIAGLPTGKYLVRVIAKRYVSEFYKDVHRRREATPVEVTSPEDTPDIDFYLTAKKRVRGTIAGRVFSDEDESSIEGALVLAIRFNNRFAYFTFTGSDGLYELTDLPGGKYYVFTVARGFIGEFFDDAQRFKNATPVFVLGDHVTNDINFGLKPRDNTGVYAISGTIRSLVTNQPVEGVLVHARVGDDIAVNVVTDENGDYVIDELPAGEYKIEATGIGYEDGYYGGTNSQNATAVVVGEGQDAAQINLNLTEDAVTSVENGPETVPQSYDLFQNYPNPFNPETTIKYQLSGSAKVTLKIFNLLGQEIVTLVENQQTAGIYSVSWDGRDKFGRSVASGLYIYQIDAGDAFVKSRRMLLLK
ncbi:MAG: collagen binding domain-containing protein [bacterium]